MPPLHIGDPSGLRLVAVVCAEVSALTSDRVISKARRASCVMHRVWSGPNFQGQHADEVSMFKVDLFTVSYLNSRPLKINSGQKGARQDSCVLDAGCVRVTCVTSFSSLHDPVVVSRVFRVVRATS